MMTIESHLTAEGLRAALRRDVRQGLTARPKALPPKWFYDERGSVLFEEITRLPEYYLTRAEHAVLTGAAAQIAARTGADTLVELGAGAVEKTRLLLDGLYAAGTLRRFVPVDVSGDFLEKAAAQLAVDYPDLPVHAVVADFDHHIGRLPSGGRRLVAILGSTIGNQTPVKRRGFLQTLRTALTFEDSLLLGVDLVKEPDRLLAAYDDPAGVTAEFNRNVLHVINSELRADFAPERFSHRARWNTETEWIEMGLRSDEHQRVHVHDLGLAVGFDRGEELRTEISAKFRVDGVRAELAAAGLAMTGWWTDEAEDFAVLVAEPV